MGLQEMLRVGQFYSGTETGGWREIHQVTETRDRVAQVTISSFGSNAPCDCGGGTEERE